MKRKQLNEGNLDLLPKLISRQYLADYFGVDISTIHNWTKKGILKPIKIGNKVYYRLDEIEKALKLS